MPSMISGTSCSHISMTYLLIPCTVSIIQYTSEPFSSDVSFTIYAWILTNAFSCIESDRLLGFIVSHQGIRVDPLKVEVILNLQPPFSLCQLQIFQGKAKFLRRFIPNYAELKKWFTWILKKGYEFVWDDTTNKAFKSLKNSLSRTPLLSPPHYSHDYFLYLVASDSTISMVLVQ